MHRLAAIIAATATLALLGGGDAARSQRVCSALESQIFQLQAGGLRGGEARRAEMLRQRMARAGCGYGGQAARSAARSEPRSRPGVSRRTAPRSHALRRPERERQSQPAPSSSGTYRTMCVRSCDGYYFPVSFSTTRDRFADDAEVCTRMCPEADVGLYYHSAGEGPETMTSADGAPYSELPSAFRYRETFDATCSCGQPTAGEAQSANRDPQASESGSPLAALPRPRPSPAEDPETAANRQGGFAVAELKPGAFASARGRFGRPVRHVGPRYGGEQSSQLLVRPVSQ